MNKLLSALALAVFAGAASTAFAPVTDANADTRYGCFKIINGVKYHFCGYKQSKPKLQRLYIRPLPPPTPTPVPLDVRVDRGEGGPGAGPGGIGRGGRGQP